MRRLILPAQLIAALVLCLTVVVSQNQLFISQAEATTTTPPPTATLTVQKGTSGWVNFLIVSPGDSVSYQWNTTNAQSAASTLTVNQPDSCVSGIFSGIAKSIGGRAIIQVDKCQANRTYTIVYQATQQPGNIPSPPSTVVIRVNPLPAPAGTLQVQNVTRRGAWGAGTEANVGDTLAYKWTSINASAASSTITSDHADFCHGTTTITSFPWLIKSVQGQTSSRVGECQSARNYTVSFTPRRQDALQITVGTSSTVLVRVNPLPDPIAYLYGRIGNSQSTSTTLTVNPGDIVYYNWLGNKADLANSTITADQPDTCRSLDLRTTFPWAANNTRGQTRVQIPNCQAGRTYTIRYQTSRKSTSKVSQFAFMTVKVNPLPDPLAYLYGRIGNSQSTSTTLTVNSGDTINYNWSSLNADAASSTVTLDQPDTCRGSETRTFFPWVTTSLRGQISDKVKDCQAGRTYTIRYQTGQKTSGKVSQLALLTVRVNTLPAPTASVSARKSTEQATSSTITVNVGDTLVYNWLATNATVASSTVTSDQPDTCRGNSTQTTFPWVANNVRGQTSAKVQACQEGRTYTMVYTSARRSDGARSSPTTIIVNVNPLPRSTATLSVRKNTDQAATSNITAKPGETLIYNWLSTNATVASSTVTLDQPDTCRGTGDTRTVFPWVTKTTRGQISDTVKDCQVGRQYRIEYFASRGTPNSEAVPAVIFVNVVPK